MTRPVRRPLAASSEPGTPSADRGPRTAGAPAARLRAVTGEVYPDWDAVYRANIGVVHRLMFVKVGNRSDAEDLTAEVFLAVLRPLKLPAPVGEVRAYLFATARTVLARYWALTALPQLEVRETGGAVQIYAPARPTPHRSQTS